MQLTKRSKANIHHKIHTGLRIYHYHTDHLGTPQELTNDRGEVVWLNYQMAWGGSFSQLNNVHNLDGLDISADELQPFRFQGQFFDGETGLHYNRFRYYDSDVGMFISRDPIGLLGGNNVFQYAPNPIGWIDPWGLVKVGRWMGTSEYNSMIETGKVVESHTGTTYVAIPENIDAFGKQAKNGTNYVTFDIPDESVRVTNPGEGWGGIAGPSSLDGRLAKRKGLPIPQMPEAENIEIKGIKENGEIKKC